MKTSVLYVLMVGCSLAVVAWIVHVSNPPRHSSGSANAVEHEPDPARTDKSQTDDVPEKVRETVRKGLEYLVKNQCQNGRWEGDDGKHPVAMTGLTGLALLMERNTRSRSEFEGRMVVPEGKNTDSIVKAVDWLMDQSQAGRDGLIFSGHPSETARYMEGHGLATLLLAGACRDETDDTRKKKLTDVLARAVKYIVKAQSSQGGWYHTSKVEGHDFDTIQATAIQLQALQAAENAGIPVPSEAIGDAQACLKSSLAKADKAKPGANDVPPIDVAAALACRLHSNRFISRAGTGRRPGGTKDPQLDNWFKQCQTEIAVGRDVKFGRDELTQYWYAQAVLDVGGHTPWGAYRTAMFDNLQSSQNKDGSWPASDGLGVGPVYAAAIWCTVLQLGNKSHPSTPSVEIMLFD